jgi:hypothetical protein
VIEIEADFGTTVRGGMIRAYRSDAPDSLTFGEIVRAVDHDEGLSFLGTVYDIEGPFIYLVMHWRDAQDVISLPGGMLFSVAPESSPTSGSGLSDEKQTVRVQLPVAV